MELGAALTVVFLLVFIVRLGALDLADPEHGVLSGRVVPSPWQMTAIPSASAGIAAEVVADKLASISLVALSAPGRPAYVFAPDTPIDVAAGDLVIEVAVLQAGGSKLRRLMRMPTETANPLVGNL